MLTDTKLKPRTAKRKPTARPAARRKPRSTQQLDLIPLTPAEIAQRVWNGATDVRDTSSEAYLTSLGLALPDDDSALRHHRSLYLSKDRRVSGLLGLLRDIHTDEPCSILRIYLEDGRKLGERVLGRSYRCAIKLDPDESVTSGLHIAVGVEDGLATAAKGDRPVWVVPNMDALASFPVLSGVEALTIIGDDAQAVEEVSARWRNAGREISVKPLWTSGRGHAQMAVEQAEPP